MTVEELVVEIQTRLTDLKESRNDGYDTPYTDGREDAYLKVLELLGVDRQSS